MDEILWQPSPERIRDANLTAFIAHVNAEHGAGASDFSDLHAWSVRKPEAFWSALIDFAGVTAETWGESVLVDADRMPGARFFPDARLNFAENLLRRRDDADALVFWGEDKVRQRLSWRQLYDLISRLAQALEAAGVGPGDRVAGYLPNMPEAIVAMLAAVSLGATWCSCSPDFGVQGVLDRFGQIEPKLLFAVEGYHYGGKTHDILPKLREIVGKLPTLEHCVVVPYTRADPDLSGVRGAVLLEAFVGSAEAKDISFAQMPFDHPLYIMFSSGTTGVPKCIVHRAGGVLLKQISEHVLHCDVRPGDRVFYFTTCSWMMWNWLVAALAAEATLLLYDGSPFHPDGNVLFELAQAEGMTLFGTSAKYIDSVHKAGLRPRDTHDLSSVRTMTSTGSPLAPESFDFVYQAIKPDLHLASISGGTDIVGCFVLGNPLAPVRRGEIQARALGLAVDVFDADGRPVRGQKGELVCTAPFPSMPLGFWNDPDEARYRAAYFERYPNIWHHGDFAEITEHDGIVIYGRSDATLNPGGVRIGTAEIYRQVEKLDEVIESIVIGQDWDGDVRVVLFVVLKPGLSLDEALIGKIKAEIRANCTPRHVPAKIVQVADIPRTKSGKITELAVRDVVHGRPIKNIESLANPDSLAAFKDVEALSR
ncbi:MAG: acetoacetate--CoA ligase [Rhodospirillales bacterium]|jgi:acetoacetyl-CoA synthetase|nr:acetoacetate--CoA ligase [Rhodospirillales bacterium]